MENMTMCSLTFCACKKYVVLPPPFSAQTMAGHPKPTQQIYMHRAGKRHTKISVQEVKESLFVLGFGEDCWQEILVPKSQDYALIKFKNVEDAQHILYTIKASASGEWVLDFEPLSVSFHLQSCSPSPQCEP